MVSCSGSVTVATGVGSSRAEDEEGAVRGRQGEPWGQQGQVRLSPCQQREQNISCLLGMRQPNWRENLGFVFC